MKNFIITTAVGVAMTTSVAMAGPNSPNASGSDGVDAGSGIFQIGSPSMLGVPQERQPVHVTENYSVTDWEGDWNEVRGTANNLSSQVSKLLQAQERLLMKPDGQPYRDLWQQIQGVQQDIKEGYQAASSSEDQQLKERIGDLEHQVADVGQQVFGPDYQSFKLNLTGDGRGTFQLPMKNGQEVRFRYVVGADRGVTPDVTDIPVVAVAAIPTGDTTRRFAYFSGIFLQSEEESVRMNQEPGLMDEDGVRWYATQVHNVNAQDMDYLKKGIRGENQHPNSYSSEYNSKE